MIIFFFEAHRDLQFLALYTVLNVLTVSNQFSKGVVSCQIVSASSEIVLDHYLMLSVTQILLANEQANSQLFMAYNSSLLSINQNLSSLSIEVDSVNSSLTQAVSDVSKMPGPEVGERN